MQYLVIFSLLSAIVCAVEIGTYQYQYNTGDINRNEMRYPNGTVAGQYTFVDEHGLIHEVHYSAGSNEGFKVLSHTVTGNGKTVNINTDYTPEIQAARDTHLAFQDYLHQVLPTLVEEELPPVYVRHVPSPVKDEPNVPIIPVIPPQKVVQQQIEEAQQVYQAQPSRKVLVVKDVPPNAQFGARSLVVKSIPTHIEVKVQEPALYGTARQVHFEGRVARLQQTQHVQQPQLQVAQYVQQHQHQYQYQYQHQHQHQHPQQSQDVHLVNGFTPEVAKATQEHLAQVAAIKAVLPNIQEKEILY